MRAEARFEALAATRGWRVLRRGWPDFLVVTPEGNVRLVEVKDRDPLTRAQIEMLGALTRAGLKVEVWAATVERFMSLPEYVMLHRERERKRIRELQRRRRGSKPRDWKSDPKRTFDSVLGC